MKRQNPRLWLGAAAATLMVLAVPIDLTSQDPSLGKRVEALEKLVEEQGLQIEQAQKEQAALQRRLKAAGDSLQEAATSARENGFEFAGPNPKAKKALIDGLVEFGRGMGVGLPPAAASDK